MEAPMPETGPTAFIGDSLTADGRWEEWFPDRDVRNLGVPGETTEQLLERLDEIVAARPHTIVLLIGTNDLVWRSPVERVVRNIELALHRLRRDLPDSLILVQSVLPRERVFASRIQDINRHLWQFAPTVKARYLDLWPALASANGEINPAYSDDGVTLTTTGYDAWLSELRPALELLRSAPPTTGTIPLPDAAALRAFEERRGSDERRASNGG